MGEGEKGKGKNIALIIIVVIILIILWLLIPNISEISEPENESEGKEIYQEYEKFSADNITVYKNEKLNVTLTIQPSRRGNFTEYEAEWVNIWGRLDSVQERSLKALYHGILREAESLKIDQIKWFEYMTENVIGQR
jgi:hypothetical protein